MTPELSWPVTDATGLEGGWDFSLTFAVNSRVGFAMRGGGAEAIAPTGAGARRPRSQRGH